MSQFRWILLIFGVLCLAGVFAYTRGWLTWRRAETEPKARATKLEPVLDVDQGHLDDISTEESVPEKTDAEMPVVSGDSLVVTVRIMPEPGAQFPAEQLILSLRAAGLQHGKFGIFHCIDSDTAGRIRYSVASLVEPGSFDLTRLKESSYKGISLFMVLPAPEDGVTLFDDMLITARSIAKDIDGRLVDEQGGALSVQRERYMREEVIDYLRRHQQSVSNLA